MALLTRVMPETLSCDRINSVNWQNSLGSLPTCWISPSTTIGSSDFKFTRRNDQVKGLEIEYGIKVSFLPIRISEVFRNLVAYSAVESQVKTLSRDNFSGLKDLKLLFLDGNQIQTIDSDIFSDLSSLEILSIGLWVLKITSFNDFLKTRYYFS